VEEGFIKFYAGFPIVTVEGYTLGTLCVGDSKVKRLLQILDIIKFTLSQNNVNGTPSPTRTDMNRSSTDFESVASDYKWSI
jgi:hypothetical protein